MIHLMNQTYHVTNKANIHLTEYYDQFRRRRRQWGELITKLRTYWERMRI